MLGSDLDTFCLGKARERLALRFDAKPGVALLLGRDAEISDCLGQGHSLYRADIETI
ncbi:MAG: hypothetical protein WDN69_24990 [Aliidongia sp.]